MYAVGCRVVLGAFAIPPCPCPHHVTLSAELDEEKRALRATNQAEIAQIVALEAEARALAAAAHEADEQLHVPSPATRIRVASASSAAGFAAGVALVKLAKAVLKRRRLQGQPKLQRLAAEPDVRLQPSGLAAGVPPGPRKKRSGPGSKAGASSRGAGGRAGSGKPTPRQR